MLNDKYSFIPWLKKGLGLYTSITDDLTDNAGFTGRPKLDADVTVNNVETISKQLELLGPGDVLGFNENVIMKTFPQPNVQDFQPNHLCFIEFYEEDFLWRFTPAIAEETGPNEQRLRPWLALIALKDDEFVYEERTEDKLPVVHVKADKVNSVLQDPLEGWAWAHVHINGEFTSTQDLLDLMDDDEEKIYARLFCPRKLDTFSNYTVFLVPSFEAGRMMGLGEDPYDGDNIDVLKPAWSINHNDSSAPASENVKLPVYHKFSFATTADDDFESMIDRMKAETVPQEVGNLRVDIREPGPGIDMTNITETKEVGVPGALKAAGFVPQGIHPDEVDDFKGQLNTLLAQADVLKSDGIAGQISGDKHWFNDNNDPVITPPLYGRYHALVSDMINQGAPTWVQQLNLEPRNRVAAAIGASMVRENQEKYMESAWEQVGDILEANQRIIQAELAKSANYNSYQKMVFTTEEGKVIELTGNMLKKLINGDQTMWKEITGSTLPNAALDKKFKAISRPRGVVSAKLNVGLSGLSGSGGFQNNLFQNLADDTNKISVNAATPKISPASYPNASVIQLVSNEIQTIEANYVADANYSSPIYPNPTDGNGNIVNNNLAGALGVHFGLLPEAEEKFELSMGDTKNLLIELLDPSVNLAKRLNKMLGSIGGSFQFIDDAYLFKPVLATPEFEVPVYELLKQKSMDYFMPNLDKVPDNSISLLESNYEFIESLLVGMSYEMGKEMLWREFPTDQRGTNFKYFWDRYNKNLEAVPDITSIHTWGATENLGHINHRAPGSGEASNNLILMLRGDLLKRYPNTVIFAQKGIYNAQSERLPDAYDNPDNRKYPVFSAQLEPDITFFSFDIDAPTALGNPATNDGGWFFVFQERPGEMAFGFDKPTEPSNPNKEKWEDYDWDDILPAGKQILRPAFNVDPSADVAWGTNSADMAYAMFQLPVRVAIHASKMIYT